MTLHLSNSPGPWRKNTSTEIGMRYPAKVSPFLFKAVRPVYGENFNPKKSTAYWHKRDYMHFRQSTHRTYHNKLNTATERRKYTRLHNNPFYSKAPLSTSITYLVNSKAQQYKSAANQVRPSSAAAWVSGSKAKAPVVRKNTSRRPTTYSSSYIRHGALPRQKPVVMPTKAMTITGLSNPVMRRSVSQMTFRTTNQSMYHIPGPARPPLRSFV